MKKIIYKIKQYLAAKEINVEETEILFVIYEILNYCGIEEVELDITPSKFNWLLPLVSRMIIVNNNKTEGISSQSYSGVSESYIDGLPADLLSLVNSKRRIKTL